MICLYYAHVGSFANGQASQLCINYAHVGAVCYDGRMDEENVLTIAQAAAELGMPVRTLRQRVQAGTAHARHVNRRLLLMTRAEVERQRALGPLKRGRKGATVNTRSSART